MKFGMLMHASVGDKVSFTKTASAQVFRVINVRDLRLSPLKKDTLRRRPENLRSQINVTIINIKTGKIQTRYFAENVPALIHAA